jgi:hypothetical protein
MVGPASIAVISPVAQIQVKSPIKTAISISSRQRVTSAKVLKKQADVFRDGMAR